jgi:hypothetical protein
VVLPLHLAAAKVSNEERLKLFEWCAGRESSLGSRTKGRLVLNAIGFVEKVVRYILASIERTPCHERNEEERCRESNEFYLHNA